MYKVAFILVILLWSSASKAAPPINWPVRLYGQFFVTFGNFQATGYPVQLCWSDAISGYQGRFATVFPASSGGGYTDLELRLQGVTFGGTTTFTLTNVVSGGGWTASHRTIDSSAMGSLAGMYFVDDITGNGDALYIERLDYGGGWYIPRITYLLFVGFGFGLTLHIAYGSAGYVIRGIMDGAKAFTR